MQTNSRSNFPKRNQAKATKNAIKMDPMRDIREL